MSQVYEMPCEVGDLLISSDVDDTGYLVVGMTRDLMLKLLDLSKENEGIGWSTFLHMDLVKSYLERGIWRKV
jgi:hypothetical protein